MPRELFDMHCHLGFMRNAPQVADEAEGLGLAIFANTVTPHEFRALRRAMGERPSVRLGVGLHPWWVADGRCGPDDVRQVVELVRDVRYVGEIGLDASPRHVPDGSLAAQVEALEAIAAAAAETSGADSPKVLSIHSVRTADLALDVLERTGALERCHCVFHWFSGTSDELHRAVRAGCWFSVNEMMLRTRRGREYARQLPEGRLLVETDLPPGENVRFSAAEIVASLERTLDVLRDLRGDDLRTIVNENAEQLMAEGAWT